MIEIFFRVCRPPCLLLWLCPSLSPTVFLRNHLISSSDLFMQDTSKLWYGFIEIFLRYHISNINQSNALSYSVTRKLKRKLDEIFHQIDKADTSKAQTDKPTPLHRLDLWNVSVSYLTFLLLEKWWRNIPVLCAVSDFICFTICRDIFKLTMPRTCLQQL